MYNEMIDDSLVNDIIAIYGFFILVALFYGVWLIIRTIIERLKYKID